MYETQPAQGIPAPRRDYSLPHLLAEGINHENEHPAITQLRGILVENTTLQRRVEHWKRLATTDELTGLANRRAFLGTLQEYVKEQPGEFAVAFVDLNGLKETNDTEGHEAGNAKIRTAGSAMSEHVRTHETAEHPEPRPHDSLGKFTARLSGDEFAVLITGVKTPEDVESFVTRMHTVLGEAGISAAIGARMHRPGESALTTLQSVDALMYERKEQARQASQEAGRNALPEEDLAEYQAMVDRLDEKGIGVAGLFKLFGRTSRP